MNRNLRVATGLVVTVTLLVSACGGGDSGSSSSGSPDGSSITIALGSEPRSMDPHLVDDGNERAVTDNIYETLLVRTATGELEGGLATGLPEAVDPTTWQFTLREGVEFQNGEPFNAESVVASVERIIRLAEEEETQQGSFFETLEGAEAVDEHTVNITTIGPDGVFLSRMYFLRMVPASAADENDISGEVSGTGPYVLDSYQRGDHITLVPNESYWGDQPSIQSVTYRFVEEAGTRLAGLLSGEYDLMTNLQPEDVERAPNSASVLGVEHPILMLNADEGITADVNVRRALNLAVDKEEIVQELYGGFAEIDQGQLLSESIEGYNPDLEAFPYDPEEARRLLEEAGVIGESITLLGTSGRWLKDRELVEAIGGYWDAVGLVAEPMILEFNAYTDGLFDRETRQSSIYVSSSNDLLDADRQLSTYYHMEGIGSSNSDAELADLIERARIETDTDTRVDLYQQALEIGYEEAYFVFLVNNEDIYGLSDRLQWEPRVDAKLLVSQMSLAG